MRRLNTRQVSLDVEKKRNRWGRPGLQFVAIFMLIFWWSPP